MNRSLLRVAVLGLIVGCGGEDDGGTNGSTGMSWTDDGMAVTPVGAKATLSSSAGSDSYEISGLGTAPGTVTVTVKAPSAIAPQTFVCDQTTAGQAVSVTYSPKSGGIELVDQSCKVVLTKTGRVGETVAGTFEAVITLKAGGTKTISNGKFNLPISM